jgi:phosphate transport system substrate-binding protein
MRTKQQQALKRLATIAGLLLAQTPYANAADAADTYPEYTIQHEVVGPIRSLGGTLGGQYRAWEEAFKRLHPEARFVDELVSSESSIGGLYSGAADLGPAGREAELMDLLPFVEAFGYMPTGLVVASGAWDPGKKGGSASLAILVHKDNPIQQLSMAQLDGIFGSERSGGFDDYVWTPKYARGAQDDIRTWGQVGLKGVWRNRTIHTYGYAFTGMRYFFQQQVLHGSDKLNPNFREYVESESKMVDRSSPEGAALSINGMLTDLSHDPSGIAFVPLHYAKGFTDLKPLALVPREGGSAVAPTRENYQNRSYPLTRSIYIYLKRPPNHPVEPDVKEFLRFILSRQGQEVIAEHGRYLPLPPAVVREQLRKLD